MTDPIFWVAAEDLRNVQDKAPARGWTSPDVPGKKYTLIFVVDRIGDKVLLGMKKRGFGEGILNGFGGKVEENESVQEGARRELEEESGLQGVVEYRGRLVIFLPQEASGIASESPRVKIDVALFTCYDWTGDPKETEEMAPEWHSVHDLPFIAMVRAHTRGGLTVLWPEAPLYLPLVWETPAKLAVVVEYEQISGHDKITGWSTALHE